MNKINEIPLLVEEVNSDSTLTASFLKTSSAIKFPSPKETQFPFPSEDITYLWKMFIELRRKINPSEALTNESSFSSNKDSVANKFTRRIRAQKNKKY